MFTRIRKRMKGQKGFTLIELLVVIIIIAILAAIAIPTFLGQRQKAQDAAAKSLVRNGMTAIESAYVDLREFDAAAAAGMTEAVLEAIEPTINFMLVGAGVPIGNAAAVTADAADNEVNYYGIDQTYQAGTESASGKTFGVYVNKTSAAINGNQPGNTFYVDGAVQDW